VQVDAKSTHHRGGSTPSHQASMWDQRQGLKCLYCCSCKKTRWMFYGCSCNKITAT
jgi:hypothetical protein